MSALALLGFALLPHAAAARPSQPERPSLVLITLDTTRADFVGRPRPASSGESLTPNLDGLARTGARFVDAVTPAPLTLPAHCSLLTGLDPPAHGVRDNGMGGLPPDIPTLAAVLAKRGYTTAAFVSSRVLDRRFGLDRGFATYDDRMVAENVGEQGYPERDARAVTDAALAWARALPKGRPYFLWIHYYDPHAPYRPPGDWSARSAAERYAGEIAYMDSQIGRLLKGLPETGGLRLVAAVGDHGEMLGEHGEKEHGILLYRSSLSVPLILSGPHVPSGTEIRELVGTRALPATLLTVLGFPEDASPFGQPLPLTSVPERKDPPAVYSETLLPATAYGWSALRSVTASGWRYIDAPRPELYDRTHDPNESHNLAGERPEEVARLRRSLEIQPERAKGSSAVPPPDPELAASLRSLGYLGGSSPAPVDGRGLDPKDGIAMLDAFEQAKELARQGRNADAVARLEGLVRRSPNNVPFLLRLGDSQLAAGMPAEGLRSLGRAIELSPRLDFLHLRLAQAYAELGRIEEAKREYRATLELNPRSAPAWSGLAEIARRTEGPAAERGVLEQCEAAGTLSASLLRRLAELERGMGDAARASRHAAEADALAAGRGGDPPR
jgi:arylsulfatase A-like enzyme